MGTLPHDLIAEIHSTAMDAGLSADREALLTGHLRHLEGSIPTASAPAAQLLCDLSTLNDWPDPVDGAPAIAAWLRWAICLRQTLPHVQSVFRRALDQAHGASASSRPGPR